jgi:hypothetical protein
MPEWLVDRLPEPRRTLHRRAVEVARRFEHDGAPFALTIKTYSAIQLRTTQERAMGTLIDNELAELLAPSGIGTIQVQDDDPTGIANVLYSSEPTHFAVSVPSLFIGSDTWPDVVTYLIEGAELIVIQLVLGTPGVVLELERIAASGRADRTVVLVAGENKGADVDRTVLVTTGEGIPDTTALVETPALMAFPRVLWIGNLDPGSPFETFVFSDLLTRLEAIAAAPPADARARRLARTASSRSRGPASVEGYDAAALSMRARNGSDFAARYFGAAAGLALREGDLAGAIDRTIAQAGLLSLLRSPERALTALDALSEHIDAFVRECRSRDPAITLAYATLVAERARMLTRAGDVVAAIRVLEDELSRCQAPPHRLALSRLYTMLAWTLRATTDVDGVLRAGAQALELARAEHARWETARALAVIGATLEDFGELGDAPRLLREAGEELPRDRDHEDAWFIGMRLGSLYKKAGHPELARSSPSRPRRRWAARWAGGPRGRGSGLPRWTKAARGRAEAPRGWSGARLLIMHATSS